VQIRQAQEPKDAKAFEQKAEHFWQFGSPLGTRKWFSSAMDGKIHGLANGELPYGHDDFSG